MPNIFQKEKVISTILFAIAFIFYLSLIILQVNGTIASDMPSHNRFAMMLANGELVIPHAGFHWVLIFFAKIIQFFLGGELNTYIPYIGILVLTVSAFLTTYLIFIFFRINLDKYYSRPQLILFTGISLIVSAIHIPFFTNYFYLGQGSPNIWHNPTFMFSKPFALICVWFMLNYLENKKQTLTSGIIISACLLLTVYIKPNFVLVFIPTVLFYILLKHFKEIRLYLKCLIIFLPTLTLLLFQFVITYFSPVEKIITKNGLKIDFLGVWSVYSPFIPLSLLLVLAFPLCISIFNWNSLTKSSGGIFAWILVAVGIIQFAFLAEDGSRYTHCNWSWGYLYALQILFLYSFSVYWQWISKYQNYDLPTKRKIIFTTGILGLHFITGLAYLGRYLFFGIYT